MLIPGIELIVVVVVVIVVVVVVVVVLVPVLVHCDSLMELVDINSFNDSPAGVEDTDSDPDDEGI